MDRLIPLTIPPVTEGILSRITPGRGKPITTIDGGAIVTNNDEIAKKSRLIIEKFKKESFSKILPDGSLRQPYRKAFGLEHLAVAFHRGFKGKCSEKEVTYTIFLMELIIIAITVMFMV